MKSRITLPILTALLTVTLWSVSIVYANEITNSEPRSVPTGPGVYDGLGSTAIQDIINTRLRTAKDNLTVLRAYEAFQKKQDDKTAQTLNAAIERATGETPDPVIDKNTTAKDALTSTNKKLQLATRDGIDTIPTSSTERQNAINAAEEREQQINLEYQVVIGDANSEIIARDNAKDTSKSNTAAAVRQLQDVERMKALGCMKEGIEALTQSLCRQLLQEYNQRCEETYPAKDTNQEKCKITYQQSPPHFTEDELNTARATATQRVQQIEQTLNAKLKEQMTTQTVPISTILRYRKDINGALTKQVSELNTETDFLQQDYIAGKGIVYFISRIVDSLVLGVGSLAVVALVIGGYLLMFSGADDQKREAGKEVVKYTIIGLILVFSSYAIVSLILGLFYSV